MWELFGGVYKWQTESLLVTLEQTESHWVMNCKILGYAGHKLLAADYTFKAAAAYAIGILTHRVYGLQCEIDNMRQELV